jgi:hypothetical protein
MPHVWKTLLVKKVRFRSGRRVNFHAPAIEEVVRRINDQAKAFRDRHVPTPPVRANETIPAGTHCAFIRNIRNRQRNNGVYFELCSYTSGTEQEQFNPDFTQAEPDVLNGPIVDGAGRRREIISTIRCVALGEVVIAEAPKGSGGINLLQLSLTALARRHWDPDLPSIALEDVASGDLRRDIDRGGGVDKMILKVVDGAASPQDYYAVRLVELRNNVPRTHNVSVQWEAGDDPLDTDAVMAAMQEYEGDESPLSKVALKLKDGPDIVSLEKYRERRSIQIQVDNSGAVHVSEIETGLWNYLRELRRPDDAGWRMLNDNGYFQLAIPVEIGSG